MSDQPVLFGNVIIIVFVLAQCLDGILTYFWVKEWGLNGEANPLVRSLMSVLGIGLGLMAVKIVGVGSGLFFIGMVATILWHYSLFFMWSLL